VKVGAGQIKDEIRKLNRSDKIEIFRWIDLEIADDLVCRIGMDRSLQIRQEIEQKCKVTPLKGVYTSAMQRKILSAMPVRHHRNELGLRARGWCEVRK
jgi:hypothetical protein